MDEISEYIVRNLDRLMTDVERRAHQMFTIKQKAEATRGTKLAKYFDGSSNDPQVNALVERGFDGFIKVVTERVLREDSIKKYLNYCPRCGALTRTPTARQCPKCYFSWHEAAWRMQAGETLQGVHKVRGR